MQMTDNYVANKMIGNVNPSGFNRKLTAVSNPSVLNTNYISKVYFRDLNSRSRSISSLSYIYITKWRIPLN